MTIIQTPFSNLVLNWYHIYGRKKLPWQHKKNIYFTWISEIMLQQTQVKTVIPYYKLFIKKFPNIKHLAHSSLNDVLCVWSGLGYYKRAHNIYKTAQILKNDNNYIFPDNFYNIVKLPGIGRTTAGSILSFSKGYFFSILDSNIKRLLIRYYCINSNKSQYNLEKILWKVIELITPIYNTDKFNQGILDLGSLICKPRVPKCNQCPLNTYCLSNIHKKITFKLNYNKKIITKNKRYLFLIVQYNSYIWLEQRQSKKIWKNLFCFPMFTSKNEILFWIKKNEINSTHLKKIIQLKKCRISNFTLISIIYMVKVTKQINILTKNKNVWLNLLHSKYYIGLPIFIKSIIKQLLIKK